MLNQLAPNERVGLAHEESVSTRHFIQNYCTVKVRRSSLWVEWSVATSRNKNDCLWLNLLFIGVKLANLYNDYYVDLLLYLNFIIYIGFNYFV